CRACGHELAYGTDIDFVPSRLALSSRNDTLVGGRRVTVQLFENPHGHQFEVITFRKADVTRHWPADKRFSWFPGFSWTVATCPRCKTHLWAFQPSDWPDVIMNNFEEPEHTFLALIAHHLLTEDFASSLLMTPKSFVS
uniref:CULT domain-containing protein n=1 Tax=Mola mola TaxID=94237 RepID=A0A3Q3WND9_MOLML